MSRAFDLFDPRYGRFVRVGEKARREGGGKDRRLSPSNYVVIRFRVYGRPSGRAQLTPRVRGAKICEAAGSRAN